MNGHRSFLPSGSERAQNSAYRSAPRSRIEDRGSRIEDRGSGIDSAIHDPLSSIFNLRVGKANQDLKMSKYAFLRSNAALIIVGLLLGLVSGFKIANSQYRTHQGESLKQDIAQASKRFSDPQVEISASIEK